jgi:hypothetical protein
MKGDPEMAPFAARILWLAAETIVVAVATKVVDEWFGEDDSEATA